LSPALNPAKNRPEKAMGMLENKPFAKKVFLVLWNIYSQNIL